MKLHSERVVVFLAFVLWTSGESLAQTAEDAVRLRKDIEALKEGQAAIQRELAEIKKLLQGRQPAAPEPFRPVEITLEGAPGKGRADAKVTLVEFTDFQCPFCRRHNEQAGRQILKDYVETGKVRYVVRQYPLPKIHPRAARASEAALCAGEQGKYFEMHDRLFANQDRLGDEDLVSHAEAVALNVPDFQACLQEGRYREKVATDVKDGTAAGVRGTPTFLLGLTDPAAPGKITATQILRGSLPYASFQDAIDKLLSAKAEKTAGGTN